MKLPMNLFKKMLQILMEIRFIMHHDICLIERIEKTKRSKNDQKPTRNGKKTKRQEQEVRNQPKIKPDQPDTAGKKVKSQNKVKRTKVDKYSKIQGLIWKFEDSRTKFAKEEKLLLKEKEEIKTTRAKPAILKLHFTLEWAEETTGTNISNQIQKDQEEKSTVELRAEGRLQKANQALNESQSSQEMRIQDLEIQKQQCLEEMKEWINELGIREYRKEEIDIDFRRTCEDKIYELKDKFNGLSIEIRKITQEAEELRKSEARARSQKIIIDDDDDDLGFYAVHPNTIHTPVSQNVEPKDSLIMGDGNINTTPETETISVESLVSNPSESDDFSLGECNLFNIDDSYYEKSTSRLDHLAPISPEIVEVCVDNDDTDDDDDCDMPVFIISRGNSKGYNIYYMKYEITDEFNSFSNPLYDIDDEIITNESYSLSRKDLDETILIPPGIDEPCFNAESDLLESLLNRDSPIDSTKTDSIFDEFSFPRLPEEHNSENVDTIIESLSYSPIPVEDSDSFIEEVDLFLTSDDSMPPDIELRMIIDSDGGDFRVDNPESPVVKSCFDFEPVVAVTNDFDVLNDVESFDSGEGENVDSLNIEEEDSFTFTIRSFLPFVTYPEVLPVSYSTGSEDKIFKPGIFDKDAFKDKSSKELAPSKALLTLNVFDPPHPPLMDFHVTNAFSGFSGFWKLHGSILWKDKAIPTISIDGLQSSLHKWENSNLLSLSLSN
ncbi:hypothetical protein Tco_1317699 [Tanacetum coccineum]